MTDKTAWTDVSDAEIAEIEARAAAATDGPWRSQEDTQTWQLFGVHAIIPPQGFIPEQVIEYQLIKAPKRDTPYAEYWPNRADTAFITAARTDVPRLAAALRTARLQLEQLRAKTKAGRDPDDLGEQRWNAAIDWLLNSRYVASEPDATTAFWGVVDGLWDTDDADRGYIREQSLHEVRKAHDEGEESSDQ